MPRGAGTAAQFFPLASTLSLKLSCYGLTLLLAMNMVLSPKENRCRAGSPVACNTSLMAPSCAGIMAQDLVPCRALEMMLAPPLVRAAAVEPTLQEALHLRCQERIKTAKCEMRAADTQYYKEAQLRAGGREGISMAVMPPCKRHSLPAGAHQLICRSAWPC